MISRDQPAPAPATGRTLARRAGRAPRACAARGRARPPGARAVRPGPRRCRCRAAATPAARCGRPRRPPAPAPVALAAAGPEAGGDRVGRAQQQPVGAGPVAVGHDRHLGPRPRQARAGSQQRVELRRVERRAVAGDAQHALEALGERALDAERRRPRSGPPRRCPSTTIAPSSAAAAATESSRVTTIVRSIEAVSRRAASTSPTIARARSPRSGSATLAPRRCLARAKRLTGRIAAVRILPQTIVARRAGLYQPSSIMPDGDAGADRHHQAALARLGLAALDRVLAARRRSRACRRCRARPARPSSSSTSSSESSSAICTFSMMRLPPGWTIQWSIVRALEAVGAQESDRRPRAGRRRRARAARGRGAGSCPRRSVEADGAERAADLVDLRGEDDRARPRAGRSTAGPRRSRRRRSPSRPSSPSGPPAGSLRMPLMLSAATTSACLSGCSRMGLGRQPHQRAPRSRSPRR